jgi:hypothetical protein
MRKIIISIFLWLAITGVCAFSSEVSDIYLDDGSVLRAEVVSLQNGVYTLRSTSMGEFSLEASRIRQIGLRQPNQNFIPGTAVQAQQQPLKTPENFQSKVASTQAMIMKDPEAMQTVMTMATDPEFQKLFDDPQAVAALKAGDMATLMKNPQFQAIMNNPKMQGFADKMKDKIQDQQ